MRGYNLNLHLLDDFEGITNGLQWDINDMYGINPLSLEGILYWLFIWGKKRAEKGQYQFIKQGDYQWIEETWIIILIK